MVNWKWFSVSYSISTMSLGWMPANQWINDVYDGNGLNLIVSGCDCVLACHQYLILVFSIVKTEATKFFLNNYATNEHCLSSIHDNPSATCLFFENNCGAAAVAAAIGRVCLGAECAVWTNTRFKIQFDRICFKKRQQIQREEDNEKSTSVGENSY